MNLGRADLTRYHWTFSTFFFYFCLPQLFFVKPIHSKRNSSIRLGVLIWNRRFKRVIANRSPWRTFPSSFHEIICSFSLVKRSHLCLYFTGNLSRHLWRYSTMVFTKYFGAVSASVPLSILPGITEPFLPLFSGENVVLISLDYFHNFCHKIRSFLCSNRAVFTGKTEPCRPDNFHERFHEIIRSVSTWRLSSDAIGD